MLDTDEKSNPFAVNFKRDRKGRPISKNATTNMKRFYRLKDKKAKLDLLENDSENEEVDEINENNIEKKISNIDENIDEIENGAEDKNVEYDRARGIGVS